MARYFWKKEKNCFQDRDGNPMPMPERTTVCAPRIHSDIEEYRSPIDGRPIGSRSSKREDLKRNDCVESDPPKEKKGYRNPSFALKRGLKLREDVLHK